MNFAQYLQDWDLNEGAPQQEIEAVNAHYGERLPQDYLRFLRKHDGGEGSVGDNFLILWRIGELIRFNKEYEVSEYAPGILLFGSDGGGEGYGFNTNEPGWPVVRLPFIGMAPEYADEVADSFENLILELADE